jgi:hypothetical protein
MALSLSLCTMSHRFIYQFARRPNATATQLYIFFLAHVRRRGRGRSLALTSYVTPRRELFPPFRSVYYTVRVGRYTRPVRR